VTVWQVTTLQLIGFFAAARLIEMGTSAMRAREAHKERGAEVVPEPWWPAMVAVHVFVLVGSTVSVLVRGDMPPKPILWPALGALAVATALRCWLLFILRGDWNVRVLDPARIVMTGPYRFIRHPNYLAVILEVAALPLVAGAYEVALLASLVNAWVLKRRIPLEERFLGDRHPSYREVMMRRGRFLPW
jgi:methyltransferase